MGQVTIGHAVKVMHDITELDERDLLAKDPWGDVARACDVSKGHVSKIPSHIGTRWEARSWPGSLTEKRYCDYANERVRSVLRSYQPVEVCANVRASLVGAKSDGMSEGVERVLEAIERNGRDGRDDRARHTDEELFALLFHTLYREANEDRRRRERERALAQADAAEAEAGGDPAGGGAPVTGEKPAAPAGGGAPATGEKPGGPAPTGDPGAPSERAAAAPAPFSPDVLAGMLAGDGGGVPPVPACLGMGGEALLTRLLPRELYLAHQEELPALAAGRAPAASAALARELAGDGGAWLRDLGARARTLAGSPGTAAPALLGCVGRAFALLEAAEPPLVAPAVLQRDRELFDRYVDGGPARALAALAVLAATGPYGALVVLSSPGAGPAVA